jgi:hypothetical protein
VPATDEFSLGCNLRRKDFPPIIVVHERSS